MMIKLMSRIYKLSKKKRLLLPLLAALVLPINVEFVPGYATEAERGRAQLNFYRIKKYIDRYSAEDATAEDQCKALCNIAFKVNFNEEPLDYWHPRSPGTWYDYPKRIRRIFNESGCLAKNNRSNPF